ncbi:bifunctional proline dehydrogenase/L-glutamate gamma-semialdehyde dehydrogenase PutA [Gammaproteobacteria bacterium]|nr:bifunctional proline dehydrogenase/L-glutamate gamma-semialdehyde dehydrogenase PutA [Gammaproteobacteria bacterium]
MSRSNDIREAMRQAIYADEAQTIDTLNASSQLSEATRLAISSRAEKLVQQVRARSEQTLMESFLAEYGLSTREGVALMSLAEALLRVPDSETIDDLISDKIAPSQWGLHVGHSDSTLVNASTWALMLTGKVLDPAEEDGIGGAIRGMVRRVGAPVVRTAVGQAMKEMGRQFVLGRNIDEAMTRAAGMEKKGYTYSYDMLGEAARTDADARHYHLAYSNAISSIAPHCVHDDIRDNPGISVKLSALHPRYEFAQRERVMSELVARTRSLAMLARSANMGFNIDAEEQDRLDLSLDVIEAVLSESSLAGWDGFGVVVQAYGRRARFVLDWLNDLAERLDRKIMVRLVKGAYWDTEIKRAQVLGLEDFPVFTRKVNTDYSYMACAEQLLAMSDRIYSQFATHNAHTVCSILELAGEGSNFEFQRLHGMGESLHKQVLEHHSTRCRIYAPVGAHRDLLAYLVRRLLENGANSSFVNQLVDEDISAADIARDPWASIQGFRRGIANPAIPMPDALFGEQRVNARGWDISDHCEIESINTARAAFADKRWVARPIVAADISGNGEALDVTNPAHADDVVGTVQHATAAVVDAALTAAGVGATQWGARASIERAAILRRVGDLFEEHAIELFALTCREAGKTLLDAVGELREAVDFARYYADQAMAVEGEPRGVFVCISPWNFPLAIFSGQILAALGAGNAVVAKPAEQSPLIAARAVELMHEAGVPPAALQLLPGDGAVVGAALAGDPRVDGICFTGSTITAQRINRAMAGALAPDAPLIAETGGLNAMIVDSTALPEQAVRDILASSFQSAGQRCSALRMLYIQEEVAEKTLALLLGALRELRVGDPWHLHTDIGPVIDAEAKANIEAWIEQWQQRDRVLLRLETPADGHFVSPTVIRVDGIADLEREIFGPILHVATFRASEIDGVVDAINRCGYGLTFGLHTRVDARVEQIVNRIEVGNAYVNRNQIGAVVGSQPFGGEGLSGTGPKAGGPHYLPRFLRTNVPSEHDFTGTAVSVNDLQRAINKLDNRAWAADENRLQTLASVVGDQAILPGAHALDVRFMPGPTGESNRLSVHPRGLVLCLGASVDDARQQAVTALAAGNRVVVVIDNGSKRLAELADKRLPIRFLDGQLGADVIEQLQGVDAIAANANDAALRPLRQSLAAREGALIPLVTEREQIARYQLERHLCVDTTAAGGNASLLDAMG